jgi:hypothetical protein
MSKSLNPLIKLLYSGNISNEEFLERYFYGQHPTNEYVLLLIKKSIEDKDIILLEEAIALLFTGGFSINLFSLALCELLPMSWHTKHEDIAMLLKAAKDPSTVNCLYNATELQFDYLDYDDTYQFARKCIKAISAIGDKNAIEKLLLLSSSKIHSISCYAKKELCNIE